ncbi:hypothetical protein J7L13_03335 [bacterium]|nr:hypothetical protein [bacterium]
MREQNQSFWHHLYSYPIVRILIVAFVVGLTVYAFSYLIPPRYCSETKILLSSQTKNLDPYHLSELGKRRAVICTEIVKTKEFVREVFQRAGVPIKEQELYDGHSRDLKASTVKDSAVVELEACAQSATLSRQLARSSIEVLREKIKSLFPSTKLEVIDPPSLPPYPVFPRPLFQAIIAFGLVLLLGVLYYISL